MRPSLDTLLREQAELEKLQRRDGLDLQAALEAVKGQIQALLQQLRQDSLEEFKNQP